MTSTTLLSCALLLLLGVPGAAHGAALYVANNGVDGPGCGTKESPCRSISQGIANAAPGDKVVVGPGTYGDVDKDGALEAGEEFGSPNCGCVLSLNKAVHLESSHGAAATRIDGRHVDVNTNVLVITDGGSFGKPGKGFLVTESGQAKAMVIDANDVPIRGNRFESDGALFGSGIGIETVDSPGSVLIEGNQLSFFGPAISVRGPNKTVRKNVATYGSVGISTSGDSLIEGNIVSENAVGIQLVEGSAATVVGNTAIANVFGIWIEANSPSTFTGVVQRNNLFGNRDCGLRNTFVTGLVADNNYWGAATGPGADPADVVCDQLGGTTLVTPFASKAFKVKLSIRP